MKVFASLGVTAPGAARVSLTCIKEFVDPQVNLSDTVTLVN